ncbi:MAG: O-antigen ligase family protein [Alphaproteobacteria bacterium]|nr:O-antigen ligase family protein [Alphaproteobacteria bacterium]
MPINSAAIELPAGFGAPPHEPSAARLDASDRAFLSEPIVHGDGLVSFALFSLMLFILQFGSYGAALFCAVTLAYGAARWRALPGVIARSWYLLPFPAFALFSVLWSAVPAETLKHAGEYAFTIFAALLIASARNRKSSLWGIFAAFFLYTAVSVAFGNMVDVGDYGARALSGLNDSKNEEADMAVTGLVISTFLLVVGLRTRRAWQCVVTAAAAALQAYVGLKALSAGAVAGAASALLVLFVLLALRSAGEAIRRTLMASAGLFAVAIVALFQVLSNSMLQSIAGMFGKDATLTGRTYLWFRARELIAESPLLGAGYGAFWQQGNLDAEGLWQFARITSRQGFNFHNTFYDILVSLGWIGAIVLGFTFFFGLGRLCLTYIRRPTLTAGFWLSMAAYLFIRMPTECVGLNEFYFSTVLLFALLSWREPVAHTAGSRVRGSGAPAAARYGARQGR